MDSARTLYLFMLIVLIKINSINIDGSNYSAYLEMASSGSIIESSWTSSGVGEIKKQYQLTRKKLVNHVRFFVK